MAVGYYDCARFNRNERTCLYACLSAAQTAFVKGVRFADPEKFESLVASGKQLQEEHGVHETMETDTLVDGLDGLDGFEGMWALPTDAEIDAMNHDDIEVVCRRAQFKYSARKQSLKNGRALAKTIVKARRAERAERRRDRADWQGQLSECVTRAARAL